MVDTITSNLLLYPRFCPIIINKTVFQYICENCLKQEGLQKLDQAGRGSGLMVPVSLLGVHRNPKNRPSSFLPIKTPVSWVTCLQKYLANFSP